MNNRSNRHRRIRVARTGILGAFLASSFFLAGAAPMVVSAANTVLGTSTSALAYQHSAEDKVAYLHDGSLIDGFFNGSQVVIQHVTNPALAPVVTTVDTIGQG